jgi:hypothetical protein
MLRPGQVFGAAACAAALMGPGVANASPFQVDSTSTAEAVELKSVFEYRDTSSKRTWIAPKLAAAFPLAERLEFEVATEYRKVERDGVVHEGLGDSSLELKWRVVDETPHGVAVAVVPELSLPTGSENHGLGSGHAALVVPVVVEKRLGRLTLSGELGYGRILDDGDEAYVPLGLLVTVKPSDTLKLGMEIAGEAPANRLSDCELSTNVGFKWKATRHLEFHGLMGRTVRSPDSDPTTRFKLVAEVRL